MLAGMRTLIFILAALLAAFAAHAGTYKWIDKDGKVHYSDTPPPQGAEEVELPKPTTFDAPEVSIPPARNADPDEPGARGYERFDFISPKQDQVFWATGGDIPVQLALQPGLRREHALALYFNGEQIPLAGLGTTLTGVFRGAHTLRAVIVGADGAEFASTPTITFHVKQQSIPQQTARPKPGK